MKVCVSTELYKRSHNKQPRGIGYWAFWIGNHGSEGIVKFIRGKYTEAKKQAVNSARLQEKTLVEVMP